MNEKQEPVHTKTKLDTVKSLQGIVFWTEQNFRRNESMKPHTAFL